MFYYCVHSRIDQNQECIDKLQALVKKQSGELINAREDVREFDARYVQCHMCLLYNWYGETLHLAVKLILGFHYFGLNYISVTERLFLVISSHYLLVCFSRCVIPDMTRLFLRVASCMKNLKQRLFELVFLKIGLLS